VAEGVHGHDVALPAPQVVPGRAVLVVAHEREGGSDPRYAQKRSAPTTSTVSLASMAGMNSIPAMSSGQMMNRISSCTTVYKDTVTIQGHSDIK